MSAWVLRDLPGRSFCASVYLWFWVSVYLRVVTFLCICVYYWLCVCVCVSVLLRRKRGRKELKERGTLRTADIVVYLFRGADVGWQGLSRDIEYHTVVYIVNRSIDK